MAGCVGPALRPEAPVIQLQELLGEGLSSRVFAALRIDSRGFSTQEVVLKILKAGTDVSGLKREFEALSRIRGPHCVRMFGWENLVEGPALVLERVSGVTLSDYAAGRPVPLEEADEIVAQVQAGLAAVHKVGLHHGDLSPGNVMIDSDGWIRLIDFARLDPSPERFAGTPPYVSPECWDGEKSDSGSDLFSLALLRADLLDGFRSVPTDRASCESRARRTIGSCSLANDRRESRRPLALESMLEHKAALSRRVRRLLDERAVSQQGTAFLGTAGAARSVSRRRLAVVAGWIACWFVLSAPTLSGTSVRALGTGGSRPAAATLDLRTLRWTEFRLNGQAVGFSPARVTNLSPGEYTLEWRASRGSGRIRLRLPPAGTILVTDQDLDATRD